MQHYLHISPAPSTIDIETAIYLFAKTHVQYGFGSTGDALLICRNKHDLQAMQNALR